MKLSISLKDIILGDMHPQFHRIQKRFFLLIQE